MSVLYHDSVLVFIFLYNLSRGTISDRGEIFVSEKEHRVSRRQFLNYTLTGVGGFMVAGILMPMTRFALDPVLRKKRERIWLLLRK